jgi:hypothetical protein
VASRQKRTDAKAQGNAQKHRDDAYFFHPLSPPRETPAIILFLNTKNSTMRGTETETTAAIIPGMFCRPNPLSRIDCIPFETRKYF